MKKTVSPLLAALILAGCGSNSSDFPAINQPFISPSPSASPAAPSNFQPSVVITWNQEVLKAVSAGPPRPTVISRALYIIQAAEFEAWAAYDPGSPGQSAGAVAARPAQENTQVNKRQAISYAAYHAAVNLFPAYETNTQGFSRLLTALGYSVDPAVLASLDPSTPAGLGHLAANWILANRANDGSNPAGNYAQVTSANYPTLYAPVNTAADGLPTSPGGINFNAARWQPLRVPNGTALDADGFPFADPAVPSTYADQAFLTPHWGAVTSFSSLTFGQLRPVAPPQPGSNAPYTDAAGVVTSNDASYHAQMDEIRTITANLSEREKSIAEYWADGPNSDTPPGHWNEFAQDVSYRDRYSLDQDVQLFFVLNGGLMDAAICCWEAKRFYDTIRPISAIRHFYFNQTITGWGGPGKGTVNLLGRNWRPFQRLTFVTPAFGEYTSGHSTFSAAGATILALFSGKTNLYDGATRTPYDRNGDGQGDLVGEYTVRPGTLTIEPGLPSTPIVLRWNTLQEAAVEAGISRRYGGIHFQDGDLRARVAGAQIGVAALARFNLLVNR